MRKLTLGRMAKLYGLHRSTLYEAVDKGRVSAGFDGKGQRVIDLAEMIRVYGEPSGFTRHSPTPPPDTYPTPTLDALQPLLEELRLLREEVRELRESLRLIEHKPTPKPDLPAASSAEVPVVKSNPQSFADLLAGLGDSNG